MDKRHEAAEIDDVVTRVAVRFPDVPEADIREQVEAEAARHSDAHVRDFVPVLVENAVMSTMRAGVRQHRSPARPERTRTARARRRRSSYACVSCAGNLRSCHDPRWLRPSRATRE
ncbi:hypothetical protein GCM10025865_25500 [Paraoerskovia sediminicola]|uniref:Uncharacterized protein n=1 Tax=Paraoerskovia sediminicola TaxID=1138587 RepID=A0ABM8G578_9CELL|nr:hypothetical protein GCM10025865_25500 [Paraoerskovia sediminicola]